MQDSQKWLLSVILGITRLPGGDEHGIYGRKNEQSRQRAVCGTTEAD